MSVLAFLIYKHKLVWVELIAPTIVGLIIIFVCKSIMINGLTNDTEYWTNFPIEARYYEDWDEYIKQTCTRTVSCGKGCTTTQTYDCSYVDYHPEYWVMIMNDGSTKYISKTYYNFLLKLWGTGKTFVNMHRDYHYNDGDMYKSVWNKKFEDIQPYVTKHSYENKVQSVNSVMKFRELDSLDVKGLYDYPDVDNYEQESCLGCSDEDNKLLNIWNAYYGYKYEIKMFILVFDDNDGNLGELQQEYWKGGNKNELVVCVDKNGRWVKTFSWCDDKHIEVNVDNIFMRDIDMKSKIDLMIKEVEKNWKRKHFSDFDYIIVPLKTKHLFIIAIIVFIVSFGLLIYGVVNEFENDENGNIINR
ncbi:hypothetical protein BPT24_051 [Tenacibaculum phage pT24]|uniref:Uncharacterized protein n=1 Tax=Tenacibaculum phage pT24 TaxID=1880590 RepID=A0A1W7GKP1_9CAUD|nr:hypothetical protein HYP10_gp051 [Tenacibaculum phage pT24]BAX25550.1 hypothetical protein BPT24_051 [Tenacibaculum phage pT24]